MAASLLRLRPVLRPRATLLLLPSWAVVATRANHNGRPAAATIDVNTALSSPASLPAPGEGEPITLDVSGDGTTVKLDQMGPLVVNHDGSMGRLTNWAEMTKAEQKNTLRILGRRNKQRLEELQKRRQREKEQEVGGQGSSSTSN
ncbi:unnamed protein product [Clonostachys rosea f. rosea IK726]|jgi:hypothetical protein|uniref:Uncharacterized protein n=1 Tax=Clonostachys rosea f. rosea IK726 TaxID=1349383 RepID=A0ACA9TTT4_BIOOC|nr:unnamed protein product [Clonostachys rosea f. rosea IK726]